VRQQEPGDSDDSSTPTGQHARGGRRRRRRRGGGEGCGGGYGGGAHVGESIAQRFRRSPPQNNRQDARKHERTHCKPPAFAKMPSLSSPRSRPCDASHSPAICFQSRPYLLRPSKKASCSWSCQRPVSLPSTSTSVVLEVPLEAAPPVGCGGLALGTPTGLAATLK
jgi:hypothetical protein